ncbi:hypothetical protein C2S52_002775 [Perilla frutescens var. hirtella]|nr:hypothetical protein C2S51_012673 [Perilla frutescens var. frutescens]KAH6792298.1 hypothetical protein C2S52_002775 [Perilla frutescens var. hirtella]
MAQAPPEASPSTENNELRYRGVRKRKWGKYVSEIRLPNSRDRIWLGSYNTAEKAARAFDAALFCLRGRGANFNFSHDPPDIAGGQSLSPAEIQVVAQRYGNSYGGGPNCPEEQAAADHGGGGAEFRGRASESDGAAAPVDLIDRSFWEMVDMNGHNAGFVSDFGLFPEPGEMYMQPQFDEARVYEDEDENYYDYGNVNSSLWNF